MTDSTCWLCSPGPCMTPDECVPELPSVRQLMARMPELARFRARLVDPDFPAPSELAEAERGLAQGRARRQGELSLGATG